MTTNFWVCQGCGTTYRDSDADMIVDHVRDCDLVDGAGNPVEEEENIIYITYGVANSRPVFANAYATEQAQIHGLVKMARVRWNEHPDAEEYNDNRAFLTSEDRQSALEFIQWDEPDLLLVIKKTDLIADEEDKS